MIYQCFFSLHDCASKITISRVYSYIFSPSENFIHIGLAFVLNKFEYYRSDTLFETLIYWQTVQFLKVFIWYIHCVTCSLTFSFLVKLEYHAVRASSKWGWIKVLHTSLQRLTSKSQFFRYRDFSLELIF